MPKVTPRCAALPFAGMGFDGASLGNSRARSGMLWKGSEAYVCVQRSEVNGTAMCSNSCTPCSPSNCVVNAVEVPCAALRCSRLARGTAGGSLVERLEFEGGRVLC